MSKIYRKRMRVTFLLHDGSSCTGKAEHETGRQRCTYSNFTCNFGRFDASLSGASRTTNRRCEHMRERVKPCDRTEKSIIPYRVTGR